MVASTAANDPQSSRLAIRTDRQRLKTYFFNTLSLFFDPPHRRRRGSAAGTVSGS
jgi:hypothetical protein